MVLVTHSSKTFADEPPLQLTTNIANAAIIK
jgi:hypothetical protein